MARNTKKQISFKDGFNNRALKEEIRRIDGIKEFFTGLRYPHRFSYGMSVPVRISKVEMFERTAEFFLGKKFRGRQYSGGPIDYDFDLTMVRRVYTETQEEAKYTPFSRDEILSLAWSYTRYACKNEDTKLFDDLCTSFFKGHLYPGERMEFVTQKFKWLGEFGFDLVSTKDDNIRTRTLTPKPEAIRPERK